MAAVMALLGAGFGLGLTAVVAAAVPTAPGLGPRRRWWPALAALGAGPGRRTAARAGGALVVAVVVGAASLRLGRRLSVALEEFTARIDDPTGQLVARALAQASRRQSRQLPELLSELGRRARDRANLQLRIAPGHARIRTNARIIVAFTLAMAAGMVVFNREFLRPYDTPLGQLVLLAVGVIFSGGFVGLSRLARSGLDPAPTTVAPPPASGGSR